MKEYKYTKHRNVQKEKILTVSEELCLTKDIEQISLVDIAKACGLTRATIYHYFSSKEDILWSIFYIHATKLREAQQQVFQQHMTTFERFTALAQLYLSMYKDNPNFFLYIQLFSKVYLKESVSLDNPWDNEYNTNHMKPGDFVKEIAANFHDGSVRSDLDPLKTTLTIIYGFMNAMQSAHVNEHAIPYKYGMDSCDILEENFTIYLYYLKPIQRES